MGAFNQRGMSSRAVYEGGIQEREFAGTYAVAAAELANRWPATASALAKIAQGYEADARRQDVRAQLDREAWE
jgi:hypothetical protein